MDASTSSIADKNFDSSCPIPGSNLGVDESDKAVRASLAVGVIGNLDRLTLTHPIYGLGPELDKAGEYGNHGPADLVGGRDGERFGTNVQYNEATPNPLKPLDKIRPHGF